MHVRGNEQTSYVRGYLRTIIAIVFAAALFFGFGAFKAKADDTTYNDLTLGITKQAAVDYRDYWYISVANDNSFVDITITESNTSVSVSLCEGKVTIPGSYVAGGSLKGPGTIRYFVEEAGTYTIVVDGSGISSIVSYSIRAASSQISWGTAAVSGLGSFAKGDKNKSFKINIAGATDGVQITYVQVNNKNFNFGSDSGKFGTSYSGTISAENGGLYPGNYKFVVTLTWYDEDGSEGTSTDVNIPFGLHPGALNLTKGRIVTTYNTATLTFHGQIENNGPTMLLQNKEGSRWVTKKTIKTQSDTASDYVVKGLKSNTSYTFRVVSVSSDGLQTAGSASTVKTGVGKKPAVNSIKLSKIKQSHTSKHWVSGTMSAKGWILGHYASGGWTTYATLKITVKKKLTGTIGYIVSCGNSSQTVYTKKNTFTIKDFAMSGKKKGKNVAFSVVAIRDRNYKGTSKSASKSAKVK